MRHRCLGKAEYISTPSIFRLKREQVEKLRAEMQSYIGLAKKQHGLERAVGEMLQNPSKGVPREMRIPPPKMIPSADNPRLSDAVAVAHDELAGRHVVALREVRVGEVVASEAAAGGGGGGGVVRLARPEASLSNCLACLSSVIIPVPCSGCANVVFCSLKCRSPFANNSRIIVRLILKINT